MRKFLYLLALIPSLAFGASDVRTEKQETLFQKGVAYTRRDESGGATLNSMATTTTYIKLASVVSTVNGMAAPAASESPKLILISNMTGGPVIFAHASSSATAANRFDLPEAKDLEVADRSSASFIYDHGVTRWVVAGGGGGGGPDFTAVAPIAYDEGTELLTCDVASDSQPGCISAAKHAEFQASATKVAAATSSATANTLVERDASGNASFNQVNADLNGSVLALQNKGDLLSDTGSANSVVAAGKNGMAPVYVATASAGISPRALAKRKNWLANDDFEYATVQEEWATSSATFTAETAAANKVFGEQAIKMVCSSGSCSISQSVTPPSAVVGQSIQHTAWVKTTDPAASVCSLRGGSVFECKRPPADGVWHEVGFTYTDPGTAGTRGISISTADSSSISTYLDGMYVGPYEPNVPATINVGGTLHGALVFPSGASCTWTRTSGQNFAPYSAVSACTLPAGTNVKGAAQAPSTKIPAYVIANAKTDRWYKFRARGGFTAANTSGLWCTYRFSDGTDSSAPTGTIGLGGSTSLITPEISGTIKFSSGGTKTVEIQGTGTSSSTICNIQNSEAAGYGDMTIEVEEILDATQLAGAIITDEPWYYISSKLTTLVTDTPDAEGEYRCYRKSAGNSNSFTTDTPSTAPSSANGLRIYPIDYVSNGSSGQCNIYEVFIGRGKTWEINAYGGAGRTPNVSSELYTPPNSTTAYGLRVSYNTTNGVLYIDGGLNDDSTVNLRLLGRNIVGGTPSNFSDGYVDVKVFNNPLAAGLSPATDQVVLDTFAGFGSTATKVYRFTNTKVVGDAISLSHDSTNAAVLTINKDGIYDGNFFCESPVNGTSDIGMTLNGDSVVTTNITSVTSADIRIGFASSGQAGSGDTVNPNATFSRFLPKGSKVRFQGRGNTPGTSANCVATLTKQPSPFEIAGMPGGGEAYRKVGRWPTTTALSTSPTTLTFGTAAFATDGNMNIGTGVYTVTQAGYYTLSTYLTTNATSGTGAMVGYVVQTGSKNETIEISRLGKISSTSSAKWMSGQITVYAQVGDTLKFQAQDSDANTLTNSYVEISYTQ